MAKRKTPQSKTKYTLELTDWQAQALANACEFYARVNMGQWGEIIRSCVDLSRDDYWDVRDQAEATLMQARAIVWPELQGPGHSFGVGKFEHADIAWELYEVLRNCIAWTEHPEGGSGVNFYRPTSITGRELASCRCTSVRYCQVFNCDRRHGSYCCADCSLRHDCKNKCENSPDRCKLVAPEDN